MALSKPLCDPIFKPLHRELNAIIAAAWEAYIHSRKSPVTRRAGSDFADPDCEIAVDWLAAREERARRTSAPLRPLHAASSGICRSNSGGLNTLGRQASKFDRDVRLTSAAAALAMKSIDRFARQSQTVGPFSRELRAPYREGVFQPLVWRLPIADATSAQVLFS